MTNINLNKHLLVKARTEIRATTKKITGAKQNEKQTPTADLKRQ